MAGPSISVIVVTRDRPELLADALASIAAQLPTPLEVRVADDGEAPALLGGQGPPDLPLLELTTLAVSCRQPGAARNAAARGARGDVLAFLDDDDRWRPGHLAGLASAFADPRVGFAWRDSEVIRERLHANGVRETLESAMLAADWDEGRMRTDDYLPPSAWGVRREVFEDLGGFDESFACSEDWDFVLRAARATGLRRVPGVSVEVRLREAGNASADFGPLRRACLDRLSARHGLPHLELRTFWDVARAREPRG
jgi:glycosyltransferase involved in cell wall biosynthesis